MRALDRHLNGAVAAAVVGSVLTVGCSMAPPSSAPSPSGAPTVTAPAEEFRYVALGDSYTIGTSVAEADRWPNQLASRMSGVQLVANLGVNGYTSGDVRAIELPQLAALRPDVVTVLIGVNDVVQGVDAGVYRANVEVILETVVALVGANRVVVVTTPDYTVTPLGSAFGDPERQSAGIRANNEIVAQVAAGLHIVVVDIYDISLGAATDRNLVASDGLHPSGAQYALWVDVIAPAISALIGH